MFKYRFLRIVFVLASVYGYAGFACIAEAHHQSGTTTTEGHIVLMQDGAFVPDTMTIEAGETVTFKNVGTTPHWPASGIHPTHKIYPEFDPKHELAPGALWSFDFARVGSWHFHDHLRPDIVGTIIVTAESTATSTLRVAPVAHFSITDSVYAADAWLTKPFYAVLPQVAKQFFLDRANIFVSIQDEPKIRFWLRVVGAREVMNQIMRESGNGMAADCHQEAHVVGREAYALFGVSTFGSGNASCSSGFYHGVMEAFLAEHGTADIVHEVEPLCESFSTILETRQCFHGVGHGLMAYEDYNLPAAIKSCERFTSEDWKEECYIGAFMENVVAATSIGGMGHTTKWIHSDDLLFPCDFFEKNLSQGRMCYKDQTSWILHATKDFKKTADACMNAGRDFVGYCFDSLGRDVAGDALFDDHKIVDTCTRAVAGKPEYYMMMCVEGAESAIVNLWGPKLQEQGLLLCNLTTGETKDYCLKLRAAQKSRYGIR